MRRRSDASLAQPEAERDMGLSGLVARTGVPAATLHYWLRRELLPPPRRVGGRYRYDDCHVRAARLVRVLREDRHLSIEETAAILPSLLAVGDEQALHPDTWNAALAAHLPAPRVVPTKLLDAAVAAFTSAGYAEVRVDDLCTAAGMAKGSFYRWFGSKDDAFNAAVRHVGTMASAALQEHELPRTPDDAVALLVIVMAPHLPLLLEAGGRAVRGHAGVAEALRGSVEAVQRTLAARSGLESRAARQWLETVLGRAALVAVGVEGA